MFSFLSNLKPPDHPSSKFNDVLYPSSLKKRLARLTLNFICYKILSLRLFSWTIVRDSTCFLQCVHSLAWRWWLGWLALSILLSKQDRKEMCLDKMFWIHSSPFSWTLYLFSRSKVKIMSLTCLISIESLTATPVSIWDPKNSLWRQWFLSLIM